MGFEPTTSAVTGQRSKPLNYYPRRVVWGGWNSVLPTKNGHYYSSKFYVLA